MRKSNKQRIMDKIRKHVNQSHESDIQTLQSSADHGKSSGPERGWISCSDLQESDNDRLGQGSNRPSR